MFKTPWLAIIALALASPTRAGEATAALSELLEPGRVLMLRHANAPGFGDPAHFRIGDCSSQRNLDAKGREQARELGARLRRAGLDSAHVYSSQWCRARETAELLGLGRVETLPVLNSFFDRPGDRQPILDGLRQFLASLPADGGAVILVTHQVVINAFTDASPASGGGSIFQLDGSAAPKWIGAIPPP